MNRRTVTTSPEDAPARPLDARLLRGIFIDVLARPPFERERERWANGTVDELVEGLLEQPEFWEEWLHAQLYYFLLVDNFRPESESILRLPRELGDRSAGIRDALLRIALSPSFDRRNPGADTFVTVVMEQMLGIEVQKNTRQLEIGKHVYEGKPGKFLGVSGTTQADVVRIAIEDERSLLRLVEREYERLVLERPKAREARAFADELEADDRGYARLVRQWLLSDAYAQRYQRRRELPHRVFARSLFVDLFDRLPDEEEVRRVRSALDGLGDAGPLRSALIRILLDSGKVPLPDRSSLTNRERWIEERFTRYLGRGPSARELETFLEALRDPACRPQTIVYAILSHPEYATH